MKSTTYWFAALSCVVALSFLPEVSFAEWNQPVVPGKNTTPPPPIPLDANINVFLGQKHLNKKDWDPVQTHDEIGVQFDIGPEKGHLHFVAGYFSTESDAKHAAVLDVFGNVVDVKVMGKTTETNLGLRYNFTPRQNYAIYLEGGPSSIHAEYSVQFSNYTDEDFDTQFGFWSTLGFFYSFQERFNVGMAYRYSNGRVNLFGTNGNAGGSSVDFLAGLHF